MRNLSLTILLAISALAINAQEIHFCLSHTIDGKPLRVSNSWNVTDDGGYLYMLYKQSEPIEAKMYKLVISKELEGVYDKIDHHIIVAENGNNWSALYHEFIEPGDYLVEVIKNEMVIAKNYLTIINKKARIAGRKRFKKDPRLLYSNTKVVACETVKDGKAINPSAVFKIGEQGTDLTLLIKNNQEFHHVQMIIDLYRKPDIMSDYSEFVSSKRVPVEVNETDTYFTLRLERPGEYKVYIYDPDQVWINSAYVTVNSK